MAKKKRFSVSRGSYRGTNDDRADRWYVEDDHSRTVDRRGPGYKTKREALREAERAEEEYGA
jgi:hypothetical protein